MATKTPTKDRESTGIVITPPRIKAVKLRVTGTAPYMQARFSEKAMHAMMGIKWMVRPRRLPAHPLTAYPTTGVANNATIPVGGR